MATNRLRATLDLYRTAAIDNLDSRELAVLERLAKDPDGLAAGAFATFNLDNHGASRVITACIEADLLVRTFAKRITAQKSMLKRLNELSKAVTDLEKFVAEFEDRPGDRLEAYVTLGASDRVRINTGIGNVRDLIETRRRIARETMLRIGATRKLNGDAAAIASAGWIVEAVRAICGKPHCDS